MSPDVSTTQAPPDQRRREEHLLFERYRASGRPTDREAIVLRYLPLARRLAARYVRAGQPFDDLFQVACVGLIQAVDRFDPDRPSAFSTYAVPTIVGELKRYFRDKSWVVRVPRPQQELGLKAERAAEHLSGRLGRWPTIPELADMLGATDEEVLDALAAITACRPVSLEAPVTEDEDGGETVGDTIGGPDGGYGRAEHRVVLDGLLNDLSSRDREIVRLRFEEDLTQQQIADRVGVSQMQVSRILSRSLPRLRVRAVAGAHGSPRD
jgi:RNA polymerase sigma-B factor